MRNMSLHAQKTDDALDAQAHVRHEQALFSMYLRTALGTVIQ